MNKVVSVLALVMVLCLLCTGFAMAAPGAVNAESTTVEAAEEKVIEAANGTITYVLPEGCVRLTADELSLVLDIAVASGGMEELGGEQLQAQLEEQAAQMDFNSMDSFYTSDFAGNTMLQITANQGLTNAMLPLLKGTLDQMMVSQYMQMGYIASEEDAELMAIQHMGDNTFYAIKLNAFGGAMTVEQYITMSADGTKQLTITFTNVLDEQIKNQVLTTVSFVQ